MLALWLIFNGPVKNLTVPGREFFRAGKCGRKEAVEEKDGDAGSRAV
jgi:hypothetical protein